MGCDPGGKTIGLRARISIEKSGSISMGCDPGGKTIGLLLKAWIGRFGSKSIGFDPGGKTNGLLLSRGAALTKRAAAIVKKIVDLNMTEVVR